MKWKSTKRNSLGNKKKGGSLPVKKFSDVYSDGKRTAMQLVFCIAARGGD